MQKNVLHVLCYFLHSVHLFILVKYGLQHRFHFLNWFDFTTIVGEYIHRKLVTFSLVLKANQNSLLPRHTFVSRIIFGKSVILLTRRGDYSYINYSTISHCNRIVYSHKSGTGHHSKKLQCSDISAISGCRPSNRNSLVDTPMPPPIPLDTSDVMAVSDQDRQPVVHMSLESSRSTFLNANLFHSTSSSSSMTDFHSNSDGFLSTSYVRLPATLASSLNTELNANSCSTSLSLNKNKSIEVESSAPIPVL